MAVARRILVGVADPATSNGPLLIGYDGSAEAGHAIDVAAALLAPTDAVVLDVAPQLTPGESLAAVGLPVSGAAAYAGVNRADAAQRAEAGADLARAAGLHAHARVCMTEPRWQGVVETAREIDATAIVLGSRRLPGVADDVARHADRPLLIVPRPARKPIGEGPALFVYDGSEDDWTAIEAAHVLIRRADAVVLNVADPGTWRALADDIDAGLVVIGSLDVTVTRNLAGRPVLVARPCPADA
jgi:nucleotide-binding universal stress UspA family protein